MGDSSKKGLASWKDILINNAIYVVMALLIILIVAFEPHFVSINVFRNILVQSSVRLILAFGVAGIIVLQGTDLSLGRTVGMAAVISASLLQKPDYLGRFFPDLPVLPLILPILIAMIVCATFSAVNGLVHAIYKVHPFIVTMGSQVVIYGILSIYFAAQPHGAQPIGSLDPRYSEFVNGSTLYVPHLVIYAAMVTVLMWFLWNKTKFGRNMYAVGGNPEAAHVSGVNVVGTIFWVYVLGGLLYGFGGFLEAARIGSATNSTGFGYELDAIAACVVGGISFSGGVGRISGAVVGVLLFTIITYGMIFLGLDVFYQYIIKGVIIVAAVAFDTQKYLKKV